MAVSFDRWQRRGDRDEAEPLAAVLHVTGRLMAADGAGDDEILGKVGEPPHRGQTPPSPVCIALPPSRRLLDGRSSIGSGHRAAIDQTMESSMSKSPVTGCRMTQTL